MLPHWYFTCCIDAEPRRAANFLAILETIHNPESDTWLLGRAFRELAGADVWMRAYALPSVLAARRRPELAPILRSTVEAYLANLVELIPEDASGPFTAAIEPMIHSGPRSNLIVLLDRAAEAVERLPQREPTREPYVDLRQFLPETLLLAMVSAHLADDKAAVDQLAGSKDLRVLALLGQALDHSLGRLAFLLAIKVAAIANLDSRSSLLERIWLSASSVAWLEPDLLRSTAELQFDGTTPTGQLKAIFDESVLFSQLRRLVRTTDQATAAGRLGPDWGEQQAARSRRALDLMGIRSDRQAPALPLAYWQATLWQLAAERDPAGAAARLAEICVQPPDQWPEELVIGGPVGRSGLGEWARDLVPLLKGRIRITCRTAPRLEIDALGRALLMSPWMVFGEGGRRYMHGRDVPKIVRLLAVQSTAVHLLQRGSLDGDVTAFRLAELIAHTQDFLAHFAPRSAPDPLLQSLRHAAERTGQLAGQGRMKSIPPELFVASMRQRLSDQDALNVSEQRFVDKVLPLVLMRWIQDAYGSAVDGRTCGRWLPLLPEVYRSGGKRWKRGPGLLRFLRPDEADRGAEIDWRRTAEGWTHDQTEFLLSPPLPADEWLRSEWTDASLEGPARQGAALARDLERCASLACSMPLPAEIDGEVAERWRRAWKERLYQVDDTKKLDRLIRLRMIELIDHPELALDSPGQELIALTLIEHGSPYELMALLGRVYPADEAAWQDVSLLRRDLRGALLYPLYCTLKQDESECDRDGSGSDPRWLEFSRLRCEVIRACLLRAAYFGRWRAALPPGPRLPERLEGAIRRKQRFAGRWQRVAGEIEYEGSGLVLALDGESPPPDKSLTAAVIDPNAMSATVWAEPRKTGELQDLFQLSEADVRRFVTTEPSSPVRVIGVVVDVSGQDAISLNCGLSRYLRARRFDPTLEPGELVEVRLRWNDDGRELVLDRESEIRRLPPDDSIGNAAILEVRERWPAGRWSLSVWRERMDVTAQIDPRLWQADLSRRFTRAGRSAETQVAARCHDRKNWLPVDADLIRLLATVCASPEYACVLTFLEESEDVLGATQWRFQRRPGENFLLRRDDFLPGDVLELECEIDSLSDAHGLLVAVAPTVDSGKVCLQLVRDLAGTSELLRWHPGLRLPFDRRNHDWLHLFDDPQPAIAHQQQDGRYQIEVPGEAVPGFPCQLTIGEWDPHKLNRSSGEVAITGWSPGTGEVRCNAIYRHQLHLRPNEQEAFLNLWLNLKIGDQVLLASTARTKLLPDGFLTWQTREGVRLLVEAESISMGPLVDEPLNIGVDRVAEIFRPPWSSLPSPVIEPDQLPREIVAAGGGRGVVIEVPERSAGGSLCTVLWQGAGATQLQISNLAELRFLEPGSRIQAALRGMGWSFQAESFRGRARGLWKVVDLPAKLDQAVSLGAISGGGVHGHAIEVAPGKIAVVDAQVARSAIAADEVLTATTPGFQWAEGREDFKRVLLKSKASSWSGNCAADSSVGRVTVRTVRLTLSPRGPQSFELRRLFLLGPAPRARAAAAVPQVAADWQRLLDEYLEKPRDLKVSVEGDSVVLSPTTNLRVPDGHNGWAQKVPVVDGPFVSDVGYDPEGLVRLFVSDAGIRASFQRVPSMGVDDYRQKELHAPTEQSIPLPSYLRYAGPEDSDPVWNTPYGEEQVRFEWGYGRSLLVPRSRLRFDGKPFDACRMFFFHGDAATHVTFHSIVPAPEANEPPCLMNIEKVHLALSDATSLFMQRRQHRIVHLVNIVRSEDRLEIESVLGFEDRNVEPWRRFVRTRAKLDFRSERLLLDRMEASDPGERSVGRATVAARLDEQEFVRSVGKTVIFRQVHLSFHDSSSENPAAESLQDGELLFFEGGQLRKRQNDVALELRPWRGLAPSDIGADMRDLQVLRRRFSYREDLLPRILERDGPNALRNRIVLAHVSVERDTIVISVRRGPARAPSALKSLLASRRNQPTLAYVAAITARDLRLEIEPGIFTRLSLEYLPEVPKQLGSGAMVRIERRGEQLHVTRAAFGDSRYVGERVRPAVAFPKNMLLKAGLWDREADADLWARGFSLGGMPDIELGPVVFRRDEEPSLDRELARTMLAAPHPKLIGVRWDGKHFAVTPPPPDAPAGNLQIVEDRLIAKLWQKQAPTPIPWNMVTFADLARTDIASRLARDRWCYHDSHTGHWEGDEVRRYDVPDHTALTGPLFFERENGDLRLRYRRHNFRKLGLPADELFRSLARVAARRQDYTVAGVSEEGGLWIELSVGRIVELPGQLMVCRLGATERSLADMHWRAFAPGDRIRLGLMSTSSFDADRAVLLAWNPGPRNAFGRERVFLPVQSQIEGDSVVLGAGTFRLTVPAPERLLGRSVVLDQDNVLMDGESMPEPGDVVLLVLGENGEPACDVLSGFSFQLDRRHPELIEEDPLLRRAAIGRHGTNVVGGAALAELIGAAGGALPVTVEGIDRVYRTLYFSRRHQRELSQLPGGKISQGRLAGYWQRGAVALIRCGAGLIPVPMNEIISGLPPAHFEAAALLMKRMGMSVWLHGSSDGHIRSGFEDDPRLEMTVTAIAVLAGSGRNNDGMICLAGGSQRLYWLSGREASWTELTTAELERWFVETRRTLSVAVLAAKREGTRPVSVVEVRAARRELDDFRAGAELEVRILSPRTHAKGEDGVTSYLSESLASGVILRLDDARDGVLAQGENVRAEIVRRSVGPRVNVIAVPLGCRRPLLDLPAWMQHELPDAGEVREPVRRWLTALSSASPALGDPPANLGSLADDDLNRYLCQAFRRRLTVAQCAAVVNEWLERHARWSEVQVVYGLMAVLLLFDLGKIDQAELVRHLSDSAEHVREYVHHWRRGSVRLAQALGRRALRSAHVEVLASEWLMHPDRRSNQDDLWARLNLLIPRLGSRAKSDIQALRDFAQAVRARDRSDLKAIADALCAATGELDTPAALIESAVVTSQLRLILRTLPISRAGYPSHLDSSHADRLHELLNLIMAQRLDVTLLDLLPPLRS